MWRGGGRGRQAVPQKSRTPEQTCVTWCEAPWGRVRSHGALAARVGEGPRRFWPTRGFGKPQSVRPPILRRQSANSTPQNTSYKNPRQPRPSQGCRTTNPSLSLGGGSLAERKNASFRPLRRCPRPRACSRAASPQPGLRLWEKRRESGVKIPWALFSGRNYRSGVGQRVLLRCGHGFDCTHSVGGCGGVGDKCRTSSPRAPAPRPGNCE